MIRFLPDIDASDRPPMITAFTLTELSAPTFIWEMLKGRQPIVLAVEPILPLFRSVLERLSRWARNSGRARTAADLCPDLQPLIDYPTHVMMYDVFGQIEERHNAYYHYVQVDHACPRHAFAYRQAACNHVRWKHHTLLLIQALVVSRLKIRFVGTSPDTAFMLKSYCGIDIPASWRPNAALNTLVYAALTVFTLGWIACRVRRAVTPREIFLAVDFIGDRREYEMLEELAEGGPLVLVPRMSSIVVPADMAARHSVVGPREGLLPPRVALALAREVLTDALVLWRQFRSLETGLFWAMASLPWRRAQVRAFFCRFHPRFYWGRDDYNSEHILRREEIHRVGGRSLGINHGYPAYSILFPMWRYIAFDTYFVFGRALYDRHMKSSWAADMEIVPAGTFGASRAQYPIRLVDKPTDIVVFSAVLVGDPLLVTFIRDLAVAFPERKILLQVKRTFADLPRGHAFVAACVEGLNNVVPTRDGMFDLFTQARYSFSDPSTIVIEALQFGLYSFNVDICPIQKVSLLREYPDLCVGSATEAIQRIHDIEQGTWRYPRDRFKDLVDLSGRAIHDIIREAMGLPAKQAAGPLNITESEVAYNDTETELSRSDCLS